LGRLLHVSANRYCDLDAVRYHAWLLFKLSNYWGVEQDDSLFLHLLLLLIVIVTLQRLLCKLLGLFPDVLGYLLVSALRGAVHGANPGHLQLELLVLVVVVRHVYDACCLLDTLL
jgi:hypothetical protein